MKLSLLWRCIQLVVSGGNLFIGIYTFGDGWTGSLINIICGGVLFGQWSIYACDAYKSRKPEVKS